MSAAATRNPYRRLLGYLRPYLRTFFLALLCMVVFGASDGGVPFLIKHALDGVFVRRDETLLYLLPAFLFGFAVLRALADFGQMYLTSKIGHRVVRDMRNEVNAHLLTLSPDFFVRQQSGGLLSRITSDVTVIRTILTDAAASVIRDSIRVIALLIAAIYLDAKLALIAFVVFPIGIWPVYRFGRRMRKLSKRGQESVGTLTSMLQESMLGNRVVKIFAREEHERQRFARENENLTRTFIKSEKVRALVGPINEILAALAIGGILLYGGMTVISGVRSQGDFIAFLISVFLLYDPFKKLSRVHNQVQQAVAAAERIFEILDMPPSITEPASPEPLGPKNTIEFEHVTFAYGSPDKPALEDITLRVEEGKKVALVGFSGAGKSTLIDLIPRFIDPLSGTVRIGGVNIARASLAEVRRRIAMVGQHTFLFNDTVYNNIAYGNAATSRSEVEEAARAAYAYDFVMQMPKGFDTTVGEGGLALSGGERQRISIARALLKDAPILILDEATASLDNRSEREVQSAIEVLERNRTTLVIAHRLSTVRNADVIVVLKDGRIVETGTHDELLDRRNGEFARLHALQFSAQERSAAALTP